MGLRFLMEFGCRFRPLPRTWVMIGLDGRSSSEWVVIPIFRMEHGVMYFLLTVLCF